MTKKFGIMALTALLAVSCVKITQETTDDPWNALTGDIPVRFSSGMATKTTSPLPSGTTFGVFAFYTDNKNWASVSSSAKPNFMYNEDVYFDGTDYTYTPVKYWPNESGDKITFWAYCPYDASVSLVRSGVTTPYTNSSAGIPDIRFTVTDGKTDFMVADRVDNCMKPAMDAPVSFTFRHALSKVDFTVEKDDAGDDFEVILTSISLEALYLTGIDRSSGWTNYTGGLQTLPVFSGSQTVTDTETAVTGSAVMPIPQPMERPLQDDAVKLRIIYTLRGSGMATTKTNATLLSLSGSWERGMHYTYKITITPDLPIEFTVSWTDWGSVDNYHMSN